MEAITLTIDEKTISVRAERTILEAAREHGISIPTLCHSEFLRPIGACRVCQVEDLERGVVLPSCVTKVAAGMRISTDSERVVRNRRNIVRLLMAAHPESCVVCEKGNTCELRKLAASLGVGQHGLDHMPYAPTSMDLNPFLARDLSKCIMCAKCIRADQDVVVEGVLEYNRRGFDATPATLFGRPLEEARCTQCGTCLSVCPVGAIYEKRRVRLDHARAKADSVCSFCACGCSVYYEHNGAQVVSVKPTGKKATPNGISMCVKGHFGHDHLASPQRLTTPLLKGKEGFEPIGWDQALELCASRFKAARRAGAQAVGLLGGARGSNEENYLFAKLARSALGTTNLDSLARLAWAPAAEVLRGATGFAAGSISFKEVESCATILVVGADPSQSAPVLGYHIKRAARAGARLLVADPLAGSLARLAGLWLPVKPGQDLALLSGLVKVILEEDLVDHRYVGEKVSGLDRLQKALAGVSPADCARAAGVPLADLRTAARDLAAADTAAVVFGSGVTGQANAAALVSLLVDLVLLTGNLGRAGAGLVPLLKDCNTQGSLDMGVAHHLLPGQRPLNDGAARARLKAAWGAAPSNKEGWDAAQMIAAAGEGSLKAMLVWAENPVAVLPAGDRVAAALAKLDFLVVADMFLSETARLADLVLPVAALAEKEGTTTNLERRVQRLSRAVPPPLGLPAEWQVFTRLAGLLGQEWQYDSPAEVLAEVERAVGLYHGIAGALKAGREVFWPLPGNELVSDTLPHGIGHPDGKAILPVPDLTAPASAIKGYPLFLMQGHVLPHLGSGVRTGQSARLAKAAPEGYLALAPAELKSRGLAEGDSVRLSSPHGALKAKVKADERLPKGVLLMPASFADARPAALFAPLWQKGQSTVLKTTGVSLRKA